jgi:hypothetical protein
MVVASVAMLVFEIPPSPGLQCCPWGLGAISTCKIVSIRPGGAYMTRAAANVKVEGATGRTRNDRVYEIVVSACKIVLHQP